MFDAFFNPPVPFLALDLSERAIKGVRANPRGDIIDTFESAMPPGFIVQGRFVDPAALGRHVADTLRTKDAQRVRADAVAMTLPEQHCFVRVIRLPKLPEEELEGAIRYEAEAALPVPPQDAVVSWERLWSNNRNSESDHLDVLVAGTTRDVTESYAKVLRGAGLFPVAFEPESFSIARAVVPHEYQGVALLIDFGYSHTGFSIVQEGRVRITENIAIGANMLTERLVSSQKISQEDAEKMLRAGGIRVTGGGIRQEFSSTLEDLLRQATDLLTFFETHAHIHISQDARGKRDEQGATLKAQEIIVTGGGAMFPGFTDYVAQRLALPVRVGDPLANTRAEQQQRKKTNTPRKKASLRPSFAASVGLSLYSLDLTRL